MVSFTVRKINTPIGELGELLAKKRQTAGWSLSQLSRRLSIAERYLVAIEAEDWQRLPGEVYILNFLRRYALAVGLDPARVEKKFQQQKPNLNSSSIHSLQKTLPLPARQFINLPKFVKNFFIFSLLLVLFGYISWQTKAYFTPPQLRIFYPTDNLIVAEPNIVLSGQTDSEAEVMINDILTAVNNGQFAEEIDLQPGINILKITATKKNGPAQEVFIRVWWRSANENN